MISHIKSIVIIFICALPFYGGAQINMVHNGSFEEIRKCPDNRCQIMYANYWHSLDSLWAYDTSSAMAPLPPDIPALFTACGDSPYASVPVNLNFHYHYPRTGTSMVQLVAYRNNDTTAISNLYQRQHAQGRLWRPLTAGKQYCVTFNVSLNQVTAYASNNIGAFLDDGTIDTVQQPRQGTTSSTPVTPQVYDTSIYTDTLHWHSIQGSFTAIGNERFITIANFFDNAHTNSLPVSIPTPLYPLGGGDLVQGLYLLDDISVIAIDAVASAGNDTAITTAVTDSAWIGNHEGYVPCRWYTGAGILIDSNVGGFKVKPHATTSYIMELDVCGNITKDTVKVTVNPVSINSYQLSAIGYSVYPNPASSTLSIETTASDPNPVTAGVYNAVGSLMLTANLDFHQKVANLQLGSLAPGLYMLTLKDSNGKEAHLKFVVE